MYVPTEFLKDFYEKVIKKNIYLKLVFIFLLIINGVVTFIFLILKNPFTFSSWGILWWILSILILLPSYYLFYSFSILSLIITYFISLRTFIIFVYDLFIYLVNKINIGGDNYKTGYVKVKKTLSNKTINYIINNLDTNKCYNYYNLLILNLLSFIKNFIPYIGKVPNYKYFPARDLLFFLLLILITTALYFLSGALAWLINWGDFWSSFTQSTISISGLLLSVILTDLFLYIVARFTCSNIIIDTLKYLENIIKNDVIIAAVEKLYILYNRYT